MFFKLGRLHLDWLCWTPPCFDIQGKENLKVFYDDKRNVKVVYGDKKNQRIYFMIRKTGEAP